MYICNDCGHTFMAPIENSCDRTDEWEYGCKLCESPNFDRTRPLKVRTATEKMLHCQLRYGIELDYLNSGRIETLFENNLTIRNMTRYTILSKHYLQQLQVKNSNVI